MSWPHSHSIEHKSQRSFVKPREGLPQLEIVLINAIKDAKHVFWIRLKMPNLDV